MAYPLYRAFVLCEYVHGLVRLLLAAGKAAVLKALLDVYHIMTHNSEKRYLLNTVFVSDFIVFVQSEPDATLAALSEAVARVRVAREHTQWPLLALERETHEFSQ